MTPADWKTVEDSMSSVFGTANLDIDGYKVALAVRAVGKLKFEIMVFVDGWSKGEWLIKDCEERRRFLRPTTVPVYKPSSRARLTKGFSKREISRLFPDIDKTFTSYSLLWPTFGPLKRHLIKHNKSIELRKETPA